MMGREEGDEERFGGGRGIHGGDRATPSRKKTAVEHGSHADRDAMIRSGISSGNDQERSDRRQRSPQSHQAVGDSNAIELPEDDADSDDDDDDDNNGEQPDAIRPSLAPPKAKRTPQGRQSRTHVDTTPLLLDEDGTSSPLGDAQRSATRSEKSQPQMGSRGARAGRAGLSMRHNAGVSKYEGDEDDADDHAGSSRASRCCGLRLYVVLCIFLTGLTSILLGYDIGIMSGAKLQIKEHFNLGDRKVELMVGILNFVSAFGGLVSGRVSDFIGRRYTVAIACVLFISGAALMTFAASYATLMLGRVITGLGVGFGLTIAPLYMAELSPKKYRGALVSFNEVAINIGILLGFILAYAFAGMPTTRGWRWMLGLGGIPPIIILLSLTILPESPRWLVRHGFKDAALKTLLKTCSRKEATQTLRAITDEQGSTPTGGLRAFLHPSKDTLRLYIAAFGANFFQQASGIEALVYYIPEVLEESGVEDTNHQLLANAGVGVVKVLFILVAMKFTDSFGRRKLFMASSAGLVIAVLLIALSFELGNIFELTITGISAYMAAFSIGWGPLAWVVASEALPLHVRGVGVGVATFTNRIMSGTIAMTYLSLKAALTAAGTFYLFGAIALLSVVFVYFFIPETKGCSLEDIVSRLHSLPSISSLCSWGSSSSSSSAAARRRGNKVTFSRLEDHDAPDTHESEGGSEGESDEGARDDGFLTAVANRAFVSNYESDEA